MRPIVLASTSPYRRQLLQRLGLAFTAEAPLCDEQPVAGESGTALVARLAYAKAASVASAHPGALIIGSDQVALLEGQILGKPGDHRRAVEQLTRAAGRSVEFATGVCLLEADSGRADCDVVPFRVFFRDLAPGEIERYLRAEQPYDCAGSFKSEGLGVALFQKMLGEDPSALVGLPLIRLCQMLRAHGIALP